MIPIAYCLIYQKIKEQNKGFQVVKTKDLKQYICKVRIPICIVNEIIKELAGNNDITKTPLLERIDHTKYKLIPNKEVQKKLKTFIW